MILFVGRTGKPRISMSEGACDGIIRILSAQIEEEIHPDTWPILSSYRDSPKLIQTLEAGLDAPSESDQSLREIKLFGEDTVVGFICRRLPEVLKSKILKNAGILIKIETSD